MVTFYASIKEPSLAPCFFEFKASHLRSEDVIGNSSDSILSEVLELYRNAKHLQLVLEAEDSELSISENYTTLSSAGMNALYLEIYNISTDSNPNIIIIVRDNDVLFKGKREETHVSNFYKSSDRTINAIITDWVNQQLNKE